MNQFKGFPIIDDYTILTPMNQDNITPSILRFTRVSSGSFTSFGPLGLTFVGSNQQLCQGLKMLHGGTALIDFNDGL